MSLDIHLNARRLLFRALGRVHPKEKLMQSKFPKGISAVVVSIVMVGTSLAADAVKSGLEVGQSTPTFNVDDVTGPNVGTSLCYR
jgi:hypothetical protein